MPGTDRFATPAMCRHDAILVEHAGPCLTVAEKIDLRSRYGRLPDTFHKVMMQ